MLRSLFSIASIIVLLLPTFISPATASAARRCPDEPPKTLLNLYRNSDSIHIGTYDRLEEGSITEDTEDYTAIEIKKHFSISSTLKGENRKFFTLEDKDYRYKNQPAQNEESEAGEMEELYMPDLEPGDTVILFLKKGEGEDAAPVLTDWRDSLKKVTKDELTSYERRIGELNGIFGAKKVSDQAITRWLVEAARDPNTRWEGAFELLQSFQNAEYKKERATVQAEMRKKGEEVPEENEFSSDELDNSVYSTLLADAEKNELMNLVLNTPTDSDAKPTARQKRGDTVLIELVSRWGDSRFAGFLVDRLRTSTVDNHYERFDLMSKISEVLKDDELSSISSKFSDVTYQEDDAVVGDGEEPAAPVEVEGAEPVIPDNSGKAKVTYRQLRDELIAKFLSRSDTVLAKANSRETAKLSN